MRQKVFQPLFAFILKPYEKIVSFFQKFLYNNKCMDHTENYAIILRHNCAVTESGGYSQFASLLAHNRTTAYCSSQFT